MSDENINIEEEAMRKKRNFVREVIKDIYKKEEEEVDEIVLEKEVSDIMNTIGKGPIFKGRKVERNALPIKEEFEDNMKMIEKDIQIINSENSLHSKFLRDSFNSVHSEKKRIMKRIDKLNSLAGDMFLITDKKNENVHYITESFNDSKAMDSDFSANSISKGSIQTEEGILTLERMRSKNLSEEARITSLTGNGRPGIDHLARKHSTVNEEGQIEERYRFLNEGNEEINTKIENILDDKPDTLFEYQMINVPTSFKEKRRFYDFEWAEGKETGEKLRLKIVIELPKEEDINWLTLAPYYPNNSIGKIVVHSIRTSVDGFDYEPLYENTVLDKNINITPQTYRLGDIFTGETEEDRAFYQGKGVWSFPERKARLIEIVLDQEESYKETLGQATYYLKTDELERKIQVEEPEELKTADPGKYRRVINGDHVEYEKVIEATTEGWRYSIGLRDINIMQFGFNHRSEFVSKRYELPRNIKKLNLYAKEIIPKSYLEIVKKNNDWIRYEVSFDDINWYRISPMHHEPLSDNFPPKIIEINKSLVDLNNAFQIHKEIIEGEDVKELRFRVSMQRPEGEVFESTTPILEELAFKIEMEDEF